MANIKTRLQKMIKILDGTPEEREEHKLLLLFQEIDARIDHAGEFSADENLNKYHKPLNENNLIDMLFIKLRGNLKDESEEQIATVI